MSTYTSIRQLTFDDGLALMAAQRVGRLAYLDEAGVVAVLPLNYALDGSAVVFATASPSILRRARQHAAATFEVDALNAADGTGWSVVVRGPLAETAAGQLGAPTAIPDTWLHGSDLRLVRLDAEELTARGIEPPTGQGAIWIG